MSFFLNSLILGSNPESPKIILLHGWQHNLEIIRPLGELLADTHEVHLIDLPGHGNSEIPKETWCMKDFAEAINVYLEERQIKNAAFIGHSFGEKRLSSSPHFILK